MNQNTPHLHNSVVKGIISRKPEGTPLSLRVLFSPDVVDIPDGLEITYQVHQDLKGIITLTPEEVPD